MHLIMTSAIYNLFLILKLNIKMAFDLQEEKYNK
jgi:hypothetical protein